MPVCKILSYIEQNLLSRYLVFSVNCAYAEYSVKVDYLTVETYVYFISKLRHYSVESRYMLVSPLIIVSNEIMYLLISYKY